MESKIKLWNCHHHKNENPVKGEKHKTKQNIKIIKLENKNKDRQKIRGVIILYLKPIFATQLRVLMLNQNKIKYYFHVNLP